MTAKIATGTWVLLKNKDMPQQIGGVDCGVFMLMYALHLTLGAPFDFTSCDMPKIRRWWTLILLENFGVFSER
ncbi:sentrin-specific protease 1-like isoform X2 [Labeo rohita]|nr:sentrin-specific protease 1-like isoform X2 [Labeo rohita]